ncbi:hypothetical protein N5U05_01855 [Aliarcobacter butzleri]|uniref:hypothetical protein n=1 Tax=Aliarcobacter butzleri TaxID=28197 RepID=UPI0021B2725B|nr:hypothetical protein [Aliarcobacter butzleri]MCT7616478.1 hypothetical protein [Aliarcobacter butzleri]
MTKNKQLLEFMGNELPSANLQLALQRFKDEIMQLHNSGYAVHQITRYLQNTHDLKTSRQTLSIFIKKAKEKIYE